MAELKIDFQVSPSLTSRISDQNGVSAIYHAWDTPVWSETLELYYNIKTSYRIIGSWNKKKKPNKQEQSLHLYTFFTMI